MAAEWRGVLGGCAAIREAKELERVGGVRGIEQNDIKYIPHSEKIFDTEYISKYTQSGGFAPEFFKTLKF